MQKPPSGGFCLFCLPGCGKIVAFPISSWFQMLKKIERWRRRRLASVPVSMRPERGVWGWLLHWVLILGCLFGVLGLGAWSGYWWSLRENGDVATRQARDLKRLRDELLQQKDQLTLQGQQLIVEKTTREALSRELRDAQAEVQVRQQALDFYDHLLVSNDRGRPVRFAACEWRALGEGRFRYRLLLAQGQNHAADFSGRVVVMVSYLHEKKSGRVAVGEDRPMSVKFRHYQRLEGDLSLPSGALPQQLEARVLGEGGQLAAACQKRIGGV